MTEPRAVLFDLDGTLIDSVPDLHTALVRTLHAAGLPAVTLEQTRSFVGHGARVLIDRAFRAAGTGLDVPQIERSYRRFLHLYMDVVCRDSTPFPGAEQTLDALRAQGRSLGLTTNKPLAHTRAILDALGWSDRFDVVLGGDSVPTKKPDPTMLLQALDTLGCTASESWLVGDSPVDAEAARRAGIRLALVTFGYSNTPVEALDPDLLITSLTELEHQI